MAILIFAIVLFLLVLVHEFGHFITAKKTGMRVDEFGIGFPPKLFGFRRGETEYTFNALPIGGFVKIYGEDAVEAEGKGDFARSFAGKSKWAQALVLVAGVTMNVLFAWFLFAIALGIGTPTAVAPEEASDAARLHVIGVIADSPAAQAGVPTGAEVVSLTASGEVYTPKTPEEFRTAVENAGESEVVLTYVYKGETSEASLVPSSKVIADAPDRAAIGVSLGLIETEGMPIHRAIVEGFVMTVTSTRDIIVGISTLIGDALTWNADLSSVAGPVGIVGLVDDASAIGLTTVLMFMAFISLNLAVINLLPFPALDGGRLLFVIIEAIKGSPIPTRIAYYANATGFVLLMILMVAITFNDILRIT